MVKETADRHLAALYARPLRVFLLGTAFRTLGDPEELVKSFLDDLSAREDSFHASKSGAGRVRHWLGREFEAYLRTRATAAGHAVKAPAAPHAGADSPAKALDRAFAIELVRTALALARDACVQSGEGLAWEVFVRHAYEGRSYASMADLGLKSEKAASLLKTAEKSFRAVVRELLRRDGAPEDEIDADIHELLGE
jgi:hypothetical protein